MNQQLLDYFFKLNLLITKFSIETNELVDALILAQQNIFYLITLHNTELKKYLKIIIINAISPFQYFLHGRISKINLNKYQIFKVSTIICFTFFYN